MRHAVLGVGGIGGLVAGALARAGADVVLLLRPETLRAYEGRLRIESAVLGDFAVAVSATRCLDRTVDALWVAVKATQLDEALELAPEVGGAAVVPLLNGVDHVAVLRDRYERVVAGAIRVESERVPGWRIVQTSPFLRVELAGAQPLAEELRAAGIDTRVREDERTLLWEKLVFLAPIALATTARGVPLGGVRDDRSFERCRAEALAVARAEGARVDAQAIDVALAGAPDGMRSSMQKDVAAGRPPELDAIAGPILRGGASHGIDVSATSDLVSTIAATLARGEGHA